MHLLCWFSYWGSHKWPSQTVVTQLLDLWNAGLWGSPAVRIYSLQETKDPTRLASMVRKLIFHKTACLRQVPPTDLPCLCSQSWWDQSWACHQEATAVYTMSQVLRHTKRETEAMSGRILWGSGSFSLFPSCYGLTTALSSHSQVSLALRIELS